MVLWIGVDDTDSLQGMCTTFLATELVRELTREHDLIGFPRLVRLNPNIPWKTRGNGAISIRIGHGSGASAVVGHIDGEEIRSFPRGRGRMDVDAVEERVARLVERWSHFDDETTNPGFAVLRRPPSQGLYWRAVRGIVEMQEALALANGLGIVRGYKNGRGVIGALSAIAWRPRDRTYEILAYRAPDKWGTHRDIRESSVKEMDRAFPSTFNNYDYENERVVIAPRSPCPVLLGIRGDEPNDLRPALERIRGERPDRWLIFQTNQGTDDHVTPDGRLLAGATVRFQGTVSSSAKSFRGGHVVFRVGGVEVTAYEPSKQFRDLVRQLIPGDRVQVIGAVREAPRTVNLEKIRVISLARNEVKIANPVCPSCGKHAKSAGRDAPFRCLRCGLELPRTAATLVVVERRIREGWYEPPVGSRRHLSKPVKRMAKHAASHARLGRLLDAESRNAVPDFEVLDHL